MSRWILWNKWCIRNLTYSCVFVNGWKWNIRYNEIKIMSIPVDSHWLQSLTGSQTSSIQSHIIWQPSPYDGYGHFISQLCPVYPLPHAWQKISEKWFDLWRITWSHITCIYTVGPHFFYYQYYHNSIGLVNKNWS